jgi:hypothetical protein
LIETLNCDIGMELLVRRVVARTISDHHVALRNTNANHENVEILPEPAHITIMSYEAAHQIPFIVPRQLFKRVFVSEYARVFNYEPPDEYVRILPLTLSDKIMVVLLVAILEYIFRI